MSSQFFSFLIIEFPPATYIDVYKNNFLKKNVSVITCP